MGKRLPFFILFILIFGGIYLTSPILAFANVVIIELMINPVSKGNADEWVEFENTSDQVVSLNGYIFDDVEEGGSAPFKIRGSIGPRSFLYWTIQLLKSL